MIKYWFAMIAIILASQVYSAYRIPLNVSISGVAAPAAGKQVVQKVIVSDTEFCYFVSLPSTYDPNGSKLWPTLIFYGAGCDTYNNNGGNVTIFFTASFENGGPAKYLQDSTRSKYPFIADRFIVISPFLHSEIYGSNSGKPARLKILHNHLKTTYKIDPARISMMGYCWGGAVTWNYCESDPSFAANIVPISCNDTWASTCNLTLACNLKNTWIRHYANQNDNMVPYANQVAMHTALDNCALTPRRDSLITLTSGGHEIWCWGQIANTAPVYDWMLTKVNTATAVAPHADAKAQNGSTLNLNTRLSSADRMEIIYINGKLLYKMNGDGSTAYQMMPSLDRGMYLIRITAGDRAAARIFIAR